MSLLSLTEQPALEDVRPAVRLPFWQLALAICAGNFLTAACAGVLYVIVMVLYGLFHG